MSAARKLRPVDQSGQSSPGSSLRLPILSGPLRGYGWSPQSGGKLMRILMGTYEPEQTRLFVQLIRPGDVVFDIGASAGYYTLLSAHLVGGAGCVLACEPDPRNLRYLREHVSGNAISQATILPTAVGAEEGAARFGGGTGTGTGRLTDEGRLIVAVRRLDDIAAERGLAPGFIKIDVEGAELAVLEGAEHTIRASRPTIFLSTHDDNVAEVHADCCTLLDSWGYRLRPIIGDSVATTTEILCQHS